MTKVNEKFIEAKQKRLDKKESEYGGEDNPLNYKNMAVSDLWDRLEETYNQLDKISLSEVNPKVPKTRKKLIDLSNFCGFLWERLGD